MQRVALALLVTFLTTLAAGASAQSPPSYADESGENHEQIWFVPRLVGAIGVGGAIRYPFPLGNSIDLPPNWEVDVGWRHFIEKHSRRSIRFFGTFGRGIFLALEETNPLRIGGGVSASLRGISKDWVFGSLSLNLDGSLLRGASPSRPPGSDDQATGYQVGLGVETTFGSLFLIDPYMFAETGASASINRVGLGSVEAWEAWVRWTLRFEWAIPRVAE